MKISKTERFIIKRAGYEPVIEMMELGELKMQHSHDILIELLGKNIHEKIHANIQPDPELTEKNPEASKFAVVSECVYQMIQFYYIWQRGESEANLLKSKYFEVTPYGGTQPLNGGAQK